MDNPITAGNLLVVVALFNQGNFPFGGALVTDTQSSFFYYQSTFQVGAYNPVTAILSTGSISSPGSDTVTVSNFSSRSPTEAVIVAEFSVLTINMPSPASVAFDVDFTTNQSLTPNDVAFAVLFSADNAAVFSATSGTVLDQINGAGALGLAYSTPSVGNGEIDGSSTQPANYVGTVTVLGPVTDATLTTAAGPGGSVVPATASYPIDTPVIVTAIADPLYAFIAWSGDYTGTDNPTTIVLDTDKSITANFALGFTLTTSATAGGSITPSSGGYAAGSVVSISATPDPGYVFSGFTDDLTGTANPQNVTMDADKSVTALFSGIGGSGPYSWNSLNGAVSDLAARLYDAGMAFFGGGATEELTEYIVEALRMWQALTSFWRTEMTFDLQANIWWYDLTALAGSVRPFTLADYDLVLLIEKHLMEPLTTSYPLTWAGTSQFSIQDILSAIQQKRDEVISTTGCTLNRSLITAPLGGRVTLADGIVDIRRVAWLPAALTGYVPRVLKQSDPDSKQFYDRSWTTAAAAPPRTYLQSAQPPLSFDVDRTPPALGQYELLTVNAGDALSSLYSTSLNVPDDWAWVIKFGALAELFSRASISEDNPRSEYCKWRYTQGLALMNACSSVLAAQVNGSPIPIDGVRNADDFNTGWQAQLAGPPRSMYVAGLNLVAFRKPDTGLYSVSLTTVQNAPVPVNPGDLIQLSRDDYSAVLDEAQHIASLKMGGQEFFDTITLHKNFIARAALYNSKLQGLGEYQIPMYELSQVEEERNPRYGGQKPGEVLNG